MRRRSLIYLAALMAAPPGIGYAQDAALQQAVRAPNRSAAFVARDSARHPLQELAFFGVAATSSVVEIWPGGGYWTEMLAPLLQKSGTYRLAMPPTTGPAADTPLSRKLAADPATYGRVMPTELGPGHLDIAPPGSADFVLTFRNLHNWMKQGNASEVLAAFYKALKPGGILGFEEHRGSSARPQDPRALSGYVRQDYATALIERAGFKLVGSSEINANPRDTTDWPKGVWTLPPDLRMGEVDRAKYLAVGEADNFVLKFRKPGG